MDSIVADRIRGVLFGQAIGDALGFGTEFLSRADVAKHYPLGLRSYAQITRFKPSEQWRPGDWTDDTDQMLCILDSLLSRGTLDVLDIAARMQYWLLTDGFGMGRTVYTVVRDPRFLTDPHAVAQAYWEASGQFAAANGAVMRTSVLGVWDYQNTDRMKHNAEQACRLTHADPRCIGSCIAVCLAIRELLLGAKDMAALTNSMLEKVKHYHPEMSDYFARTAEPSLEVFDLDEGMNSGKGNRIGYTLKALGCSFWALRHSASFEEGILAVIHEGGDADTNAAIAGSMLGARFGFSSIPSEWLTGLIYRGELESRAERLIAALDNPSPPDSGG
ncbi:MAG: ADP-ribosylglycohydrolase family protein [Planctomycetia bacterium]|nr:ADP-ribosylglycohydrolase family protein [Planctomycetia bacterium]